MEKDLFSCPTYKKKDWHKGRMKLKQKVTKGKFGNVRKSGPSDNNETSSTNQERDDVPLTPVIDIADSSDDHSSEILKDRWYKGKKFDDDDDDDDRIENQQMKAENFETLQKSSSGGHFIFRSEKQWDEETIIENNETNQYFKLNLKLIKAGLATIPFYKRMDYDSSMFTKNQLKEMNNEAEKNEKYYQILMKDYEERKLRNNSGASESQKSVSKRTASSVSSSTNKNRNESKIVQNERDDELLDELLDMTTKNIENVKLDENAADDKVFADDVENTVKEIDVASGGNHEEQSPGAENIETNKKEDIQDWLDGILDE